MRTLLRYFVPPCEWPECGQIDMMEYDRGMRLAFGRTNGGNPLQAEFPARFDIDSVRVYKR